MMPPRNESEALSSVGDDNFDGLSDEDRDLIVRQMVMRALVQLGLSDDPSAIATRRNDDGAGAGTCRRD